MKQYVIFFILLFSGILVFGEDSPDNDNDGYLIAQESECSAEFSFSIINKSESIAMVKFRSSISRSSVRYYWYFGDGSKSREDHPVHTFKIADKKEFVVTLKVTTGSCSDQQTRKIQFSEKACSAEFTYKVVKNERNIASIRFNVTSQDKAASYVWSFGDGKGSKRMEPTHTYRFKGKQEFRVRLRVQKNNCKDQQIQTIALGESEAVSVCSAEFSYEILSIDNEGAIVQFSGDMEEADEYSWDFGDRSSSDDGNPVHVYKFKGRYQFNVTLTVQKGKCRDSYSDTLLFPDVHEEEENDCSADFTYEILDESPGQAAVRFKSLMTDASEYEWSFGDGESSNDRNPAHIFKTVKQYSFTVTLAVQKGKCRDMKKETITFKELVKETCSADFSYEIIKSREPGTLIRFTSSMADASSYSWNFGDGSTSKEQNPAYRYDRTIPRHVTVTLEVKNGSCSDAKSKVIELPEDAKPECSAVFSYNVLRQDTRRVMLQFTPESSDYFSDFYWDFGDGDTSTKSDPIHTYTITKKQQFTVVLRVSKEACEDRQSQVINLGAELCTAEFTVAITYNDGKFARVEVICKEKSPDADFTCNFGDGTISKEWNPVHTYNISRKKKYNIILRVKKGDCDEQSEQEISF